MAANPVPDHVAHLRMHLSDADEGAIWALYVDAGDRPLLATALHDGMARLDDQAIHSLAYQVAHVGADAVLIAIPRASGEPYDADRALWHRLHALTVGSETTLLDLVVVGERSWWSASSDIRTTDAAA